LKEQANTLQPEDIRNALLLAGNTGDILEWEKLSTRISRSPPPLGERAYCNRLLDIANGIDLTGFQWNQLVGLSIMLGVDGVKIPTPAGRIAWLKTNLATFVDGTKSIRTAMAADAARDLNNNRVLIVPSYSNVHGRQDRVISTGINSAMVYGVWLLFDPRREYAANLRKCRYSRCGAFLFKRAETGGAPIRQYCSDEHAKVGIREAAKTRMQKLRRRQK
jgi:hypothetical protein